MRRKRSHKLGRVARRVVARKRNSVLSGFGSFGSLGKSLETIALRTPPATDVSGGNFDEAIARWVGKLQAQHDARTAKTHASVRTKHPGLLDQPSHRHFAERRVVAERGPKYVKIVVRDVNPDGSLGGGSVTAFVERTTGNIYKPASWRGPTRNFVRGNVYDLKEPRTHY